MSLWNTSSRMLVAVVLTGLAFCRVAAGGQGLRETLMMPSGKIPDSPTVTVASLRIPTGAWKHFNRAKSAIERNRPEEFERETRKALEIAPRFAQAHLLRATVMVAGRRFAGAVDEVEAARRSDPGVQWAGVILAQAYNGLHRYNDARLALEEQRGTESESWQAVYERGRAEIGMGDVEAGLRWSARALETAPTEFADAHLLRANALLLAQRWSEALDQMEIYLESRGPQLHRAEVLAMREQVRARLPAESNEARVRAKP